MTIRAFKLRRDADVLTDIILRSFQYPENPEWNLDDSDVADVEMNMKAAKRLYPLLRIAGLLWKRMAHMLDGFVWEEDGQSVAICNITLQGDKHWMIGNVSVVPEYRRHGIGRQLVQACIDHAAAQGAEHIILDVIDGNLPAYELYKRLGFEHYTSLSIMDYAGDPVGDTEHNLSMRELKFSDWRLRRDFMDSVTPTPIQKYEPVYGTRFRIPLLMRPVVNLIMAVISSTRKNFAILDESREVCALATYDVPNSGKGIANLSVYVDDSHAYLRPAILKWLISQSQKINREARIELSIPSWQEFDENSSPGTVGFIQRLTYHRLGILIDG